MKKNKFIISLLAIGVMFSAVGCNTTLKEVNNTGKETVKNIKDELKDKIEVETDDDTISADELKNEVGKEEEEKIKQEIEDKFKEDGQEVTVNEVYAPKIDVDVNYENVFSSHPDSVKDELIKAAKELTGLKAENFKFAKIDGEEQDLSQYYGKPFVMEIMSSTCSACMALAPTITEFKEKYPDVPVLQVVRDSENTLREAQTDSVDLHDGVITKDENFDIKYPYHYVPTLLFINEDGYIVEVRIGNINLSEIVGVYSSNFGF